MFIKLRKINNNSLLWSSFVHKQTLQTLISNSYSKQHFGKLPGRPESVLKKNSTWIFYWKVIKIFATLFLRTNFIKTIRLKLATK